MTRTQRQNLCIKRWLEAGGRATIVAATGFGVAVTRYFKNIQMYFLIEYQDLLYDAAPIPEGFDEKLTKNGKLCDENTVVTEETKESSAPYSVETEPDLSE